MSHESDLAHIAALEAHQDGRREHIGEIEEVIQRKQLEIDNLRARLNDPAPPAPSASPRPGLSACP